MISSARQALVAKLESQGPLTDEARQALSQLPIHVRQHRAGEDIVREGDAPKQACLVVEGWLFRYKLAHQGRRQILGFHIAGEIPDLHSLHLGVMDHTLAALSSATVGVVAHTDLRRLTRLHPCLADLLWRETLIDAAIFREWMAGLGRRDALARAAHLVCEMYVRLAVIGLARDHRFRFPMTQEALADALGLTGVHVNRTLQALRSESLLTWQGHEVVILDWGKLAETAEFDPTYLHLKRPD